MSLVHLVEVDEYLGVARGEVDVVGEEHRCVAVAVEGYDALVQSFGLFELLALYCQPLEDGHHVSAASENVCLGMPLHAEDRLILVALHCFYDSVGACCRHS